MTIAYRYVCWVVGKVNLFIKIWLKKDNNAMKTKLLLLEFERTLQAETNACRHPQEC